MIASSFLVVVAVVAVALPPAEACTYWCMNPQTGLYVCCDDGNPWYTGGGEDTPTEKENAVVDLVPADDVAVAGSSGCLYYCNYNSQVYCCDNGEGPREYFIPPYHIPHYTGPHVLETLPPNYIVRTVPGYDSISQTNPIGLFRNTIRILDADNEEETRDSGSFPFDMSSIFRNPLTAIFNSGEGTGESSEGSRYRQFIDHVINSPTLGRLAFDSLMNMISSGSPEERAETSKSLDESNFDKRQTDNNDGLNPSPSSNNIYNTVPTLDDMSSLFVGNGEDDNSRTEGTGHIEMGEVDIPILSPVPLINKFAVSGILGVNSISGGVPLVPSNNSFVSSNPSDLKSVSNRVPLLPELKKSLSEGIPLVPADNSFASPNHSETNPASNGVPLIPIINSFSASNISGILPNSIGVPLISSDNSFPDTNQLHKHNISNKHTIDISQRLPHSQGVPLPITQGQANTAFVMQHLLQQPEMANAVMHSQQSPSPLVVSKKGSHQQNTEEVSLGVTEESYKTDSLLTTIETENSLVINDTLESKKELSDVSTLPLIETENSFEINDALESKDELSDVSTLPKIAFEDILNTDVTHTQVIPVDLDTHLTLSHPSQLTQTENPSILEMYGTLPTNTAPHKLSNAVPIHYQQYPLPGRLQGQQVRGSISYSTNQHRFPPYYSQKNGYPMPSTKQFRRPNIPFVQYQTPNIYPNPTYYPPHPKPTYDPSSIRFTPDFILTGSDTPGLPPTGLMPPSNDLKFFSHIPASISDTIVAPPIESVSADDSGDFVTDDVLDLVMNINKATCLCLENGERRTDKSCPCSIEDLVVVFPPTPLQPYLLLPLSKSESFVEKYNFDKIENSLSGEELITSPSEYSIQKVSSENKHIKVSKENSETYPEQRQQTFLEVLKRFHNLSNQIHRRTLADILGNSSKLPKVEINKDQIEELINSETINSSKIIPSQS